MTTGSEGKGGAETRRLDPDDNPATEVADNPSGASTAAGPCEDATEIVPAPTEAAPELAWSQENEQPHDLQPWVRTWLIAAAILVVLGLIAAVIAVPRWMSRGNPSTARLTAPPVSHVAAGPAVAPPPELNGTYEIESYPAETIYRLNEPPPMPPDNAITHIWWAFRSACLPAGCTAHGAKLDKDNHQRFDSANFTDDLTYINGAWQDATPAAVQHDCGNGKSETVSVSWGLEPQPDGTLRGVTTYTTTTDGCGYLGNTTIEPFRATRIGDAPAGLLVPSTVPQVAPAPDVPLLPVQTVSSDDEKLLAQLADHGVIASEFHHGNARGAGAVITAAHTVCDMRAKGVSTPAIVSEITAGFELSADQANWLARLAMQTYCPQYGG